MVKIRALHKKITFVNYSKPYANSSNQYDFEDKKPANTIS